MQERFGDRDGGGTEAQEVEKHRDAAFLDKNPDDKGKRKVRYTHEGLNPALKSILPVLLTSFGFLPETF